MRCLSSYSTEHGSQVAKSPQRRQQALECISSLQAPSASARTFERCPQSHKCGRGSKGIHIPYDHEPSPTVDITWVGGLAGAGKSALGDEKDSNVSWTRDFIPQWRPRSGRAMIPAHYASLMRQNGDKSNAPKFEEKNPWPSYMYAAAQDTGDSEGRTDRPRRIIHREVDGRRDPVQGRDVGKHYQMISYRWGRQDAKKKEDAAVTTMVACKDASYTSQDSVLRGNYMASLEHVIEDGSPTRAASPKYREFVGFARYRRLHRVLVSFVSSAVALGYPTTVSAAALPWKCNLCSGESALLEASMNSKVVLMPPWFPGRHILLYLAFCSVVPVLVYLQGTGEFLKYSFVVCSGLLGLICVSAGTETMLRFLPLVVLLTLLVSWVFQVFVKFIRAPPRHGAQNEQVASPGCALRPMVEKDSEFSVN